jgi:small subunit ribosomal protein S17
MSAETRSEAAGAPQAASGAATAGPAVQGRKRARTIAGVVTSAKMQKTIVVRIEWLEKHAKYGKFMRRHSRFKAHDENREAKEGDIVAISQTRPLSKTKRWRLVKVIQRAQDQKEQG